MAYLLAHLAYLALLFLPVLANCAPERNNHHEDHERGCLYCLDAAGEALAELRSIFEEARGDPEFLHHLQSDIQPFLNKMPDEVKDDVPLIELARQQRFSDLVQQVAPGLIAKLSSKVA